MEVPLPPEEAWPLLLDIPLVAPCLPGTTLSEVVDENTYKGTVALKLGPINLSFAGQAEIEEIDTASRTVTVKASGQEQRGRGMANARVSFTLTGIEDGTRVDIATDLTLAGAVIQYARGAGVVTRTAQQLVDDFATRLRERLEQGDLAGADGDPEAIRLGSLVWRGLRARAGESGAE